MLKSILQELFQLNSLTPAITGVIAALISAFLKGYLMKRQTLKVVIRRGDGKHLEIEAPKNTKNDELKTIITEAAKSENANWKE